jgi:hypothetical protein
MNGVVGWQTNKVSLSLQNSRTCNVLEVLEESILDVKLGKALINNVASNQVWPRVGRFWSHCWVELA